MFKLSNIFNFCRETVEEGKKLTFPGKKDVYMTSLNIFVIVIICAICIVLTDLIVSKIIKFLFGLGN